MMETLINECFSYVTFKNWVAEFMKERSDVKDGHRSGRQISMTTSKNIDSVHDIILVDRGILDSSL